MRAITRRVLSKATDTFLEARARKVESRPKKQRVEEARRLWTQRSNAAFAEVKETLRLMAHGRARCMYCEDSIGTDIDHFRPKAKYPELAFAWPNYLLACSHCNSNEKRDQFPLNSKGQPKLLDPSVPQDDPLGHFVFVPDTGQLVAQTQRGRVTSRIFGLDRQLLEEGRKHMWTNLGVLLRDYDQALAAGKTAQASKVADVIRNASFSSVLVFLVAMSRDTIRQRAVPPNIRAILRRRPEVLTWVS